MLGLKITMTGMLIFMFSLIAVGMFVKRQPKFVMIPILMLIFGGALAAVVGIFLAIWL